LTTSERPMTGTMPESSDQTPTQGPQPWRPGVAAAGLVGVIAMGMTIGIAELIAGFGEWIGVFNTPASPLASLGQTFIQFTPEWLKEFAIRTFGEYDKVALTAGMGITLFLVAIIIGVVGRVRPRIAVGITIALIVVTAGTVFSRTGATLVDTIPILFGGAAGIWFLVTVFRLQLVPASAASAEPVAGPVVSDSLPSVPSTNDNPKAGTTGAVHPMSRANAAASSAATRRQFFKLAGIGAIVAVAAGAIAKWIPSTAEVAASRSQVALPTPADIQPAVDVDLKIDGITPFVTDNADFYRVDTAFVVPRVTTDDWLLHIHGMVDKEITLSYADLIAMPSIERMVTLTCVSNEVGGDLAGNARWQGVRIADVLKSAGPQAGADCVLSTSVDGFTVTTPLEALTDDRDALFAFAMNGEPLPVEHGFPVRQVVPGLYGYVSATKWVVDLKVTKFADETAYWTSRGWSAQAPIKTASRIDVPKSFAQVSKGTVAIAGMAWAQHRGITGVQVQVDDGEWQDATLSGEVSADTWRQWVYHWDATATGQHTIRCRAIDSSGTVQTDQIQGVMPDGATGWDSRSVTVTA
jgi:DMSO/TMAO reductase YedYZ molybdopterin-dependent catalytic subunit